MRFDVIVEFNKDCSKVNLVESVFMDCLNLDCGSENFHVYFEELDFCKYDGYSNYARITCSGVQNITRITGDDETDVTENPEIMDHIQNTFVNIEELVIPISSDSGVKISKIVHAKITFNDGYIILDEKDLENVLISGND